MASASQGGLIRRLFSLALPLAAQNVISYGVGLADNLMVGRLGEDALSGVFVANQVTNILNMLMIGTGAALVILAAQYWGKGDARSVKTISSMVLKLGAVIGVLFFFAMFFFGAPILGILTTDQAAVAEGVAYAKAISVGYVFYCTSNALLSSMRCVGSVRIGLVVTASAFVINVGLNAVLIFGLLGFPAMGAMGAGIATTVSRVVELAIVLVYVLKVDKKLRLRPGDLKLFDKRLAADFFRYGAPVMLGDVLWGIGGAAQAAILGRLGSAVMSASSMAGNIHQIFGVMVYGTSGASGIIIGQTVGEGDVERVKRYAKKLQFVFLGIGLCSGALMFLLKDAVLYFYRDLQPDTLEIARQFLTVMSVTLVGTGYQMSVLTGIVRAGGATNFVLINDLIFVWLVVIPSSALAAFVFNAPPWVVFALLKGDQIYKCIVAVIKVNRFKWIRNLTREDAPALQEENA